MGDNTTAGFGASGVVVDSAQPGTESDHARTREWVEVTARAGALLPWVQPIFDTDTQLVGCEVLARCPFPDGSLRSPDSFAESLRGSDVWAHLDTAMLTNAAELSRFASGSPAPFSTSWNVAVSSLDERYLESVEAALAASALEPSDLCLELTEHVQLRDGVAVEVLRAIRGLGVGLAIDDIGENPSLFLAMRRVGVDWVKLDRTLSHEVASARGRQFLGGIISMVHDLGAGVVAEGIETEAMKDRLVELGCDRLQGNHLGTAMSAESFRLDWLGAGAEPIEPRRAG